MTRHPWLIFTIIVLFLSGCASAPQQPIQLDPNKLTSQNSRLGIAMTAVPKVDTYLPGAGCLLCMAVAAGANSKLTTHALTLPAEDLPKLKSDLAELLRKKGLDVTIVEEALKLDDLQNNNNKGPIIAKKDFSPLKKKYNIDKLLVINITTLGFLRTYSSYIPTSDPQGALQGEGYIVNLGDNTYEWYMPVNVLKSADGEWDEPPKFPGLTNAYFQALEIGKDSFLNPFRN